MKLLALDLGTKIGAAFGDGDMVGWSEVKNFSSSGKFNEESFGQFYHYLYGILTRHGYTYRRDNPITIVCEKPNSHMPSWDGIRVHFGMYGLVQLLIANYPDLLKLDVVPALTIKKFWTGSGRASKEDMIFTAQQLYPDITDDNEADAVALWHYCMEELYPGG